MKGGLPRLNSVLYLQKYYSKNPNPLKGCRLFERFQIDAEKCRLSYIVRPNKDVEEVQFINDVVTYEELEQLKPELIFLEGDAFNGDQCLNYKLLMRACY